MYTKIKKQRILNDLTVEYLCKKLNTTPQHWSLWENKKIYPNLLTAIQIARLLGTTVEEIWGEDIKEG